MKYLYLVIALLISSVSFIQAQWKGAAHFMPLNSISEGFEDYDGFTIQAGAYRDITPRIGLLIMPYYSRVSGENYRYIDPRVFSLSAPYLDKHESFGVNAHLRYRFTEGIVRPYVQIFTGFGNTWYTSDRYEVIEKDTYVNWNYGGGAGFEVHIAGWMAADLGFQATGQRNLSAGETIKTISPVGGVIFKL